jgi:hypothetical protein
MRTFRWCTLCILLISVLVANGVPSALAETKHRAVRSGSVSGTVRGTFHTNGSAYYECSKGSCTCANAKDCGVMGGDHVCVDKSFSGSAGGGGSCTEKTGF